MCYRLFLLPGKERSTNASFGNMESTFRLNLERLTKDKGMKKEEAVFNPSPLFSGMRYSYIEMIIYKYYNS